MHEIVIIVAQYFILIPVFVVAWAIIAARKKQRLRMLALLIISGILTELLAKLGSHVYYDPRPFVASHVAPYFMHAPDNGFPSDHTLLAALLAYWVMAYHKRMGLLLLAVALLIGASRVIAGVHHVYDIVGSLIFAGLGLILAFGILRVLRRVNLLRAA